MRYTVIVNFEDGGDARVMHDEGDCIVISSGNDYDEYDMELTREEALALADAIKAHFGEDSE